MIKCPLYPKINQRIYFLAKITMNVGQVKAPIKASRIVNQP